VASSPVQVPQSIRFGEGYELDLRPRRLRRGKHVVKLERIPLEMLVLLVERRDEIVTRDEIVARVWGKGVFLDTDNSIRGAIRKLRQALKDDAESPRFIQTVTGQGYRFIAPVTPCNELNRTDTAAPITSTVHMSAPAAVLDSDSTSLRVEDQRSRATVAQRSRVLVAVVATGVVVACAALFVSWWLIPQTVPVVDSINQLTEDPQSKSNLVIDGSRIYFREGVQGSSRIAQVSIEGGRSVRMESSLADPVTLGAARDGSALLAITEIMPGSSGSLWSIPLPAGEPRRLGNAVVQSADWFPDNRIIYAVGKDILIAENDASGSRKLASLPGIVWNTVVSPDGTRVLFQVDTRGDSKWDTFEMHADGTSVRQIRKAEGNECCFHWSWDGRYLLYSARTGKRWDLWAVPFHGGLFRRSEKTIQLTNGPISFAYGALASRDGKQIFAIGSKERGELVRFDMKSRQFVPLLSGISATDATYSSDGNWVAYIMYPEHTLWRSRSDGSERMQLTYPPMEVWEPFISPDGKEIAFDNGGNNSVCVIDMNGGSPRTVSSRAFSPRWSPDGNSVVYNRVKADGMDNGLEIAEIATGKKSEVPSPDGKLGAFWLDEQSMAAADGELKNLEVFDFRTKTWTVLVAGNFRNWLQNWINSPDGKFVYYAAGGPEESIQRVRVADRHVETVNSLKDFTRASNPYIQLRMTADGSPSLTRALDSEEIYVLNVRWP
jgi:DNA-binding winged helix-turn-helix (wHTH) protein/WD40 repeat protein